ncbi:endo-1,4-beta-xylanase A precursor [Filimonas lacunae]|nr:endo-1,4-beta-xylanase A precursor [Filimonas lacunae]
MKDTGTLNTTSYSDTTATLKAATEITMGVAVDYTPMTADSRYAAVVKRDFDGVTFGYHMKHGAIVQDNGTLNFSRADDMVAASSGLIVFGHTLGWHSNQNATYLKKYAGIVVPAAAELLPANAGFESGLTGWSVFNTGNPSGTSTITTTTVSNEVHGGTTAMKVVNPTAYPGSQWRVQVSSASFPTTTGKKYTASYFVKAANAGGSIRLSLGQAPQSGSQYQGDQPIGTAWQQISFDFVAGTPNNTFLFDMGQAANTYYIDDASVKEFVAASDTATIVKKLDTALNTFITGTVTHFKSTVKAWDVVNEVVSPTGFLRTTGNSSDVLDKSASDVFFWTDFLGRDFAYKAFKYAEAADPAALLFINDYALESSSVKLDSLLLLVKELKARGAKVDGIGTQMHIAWNTTYNGIDAMMQKLAASGLLIRISELDVKANPLSRPGFVLTSVMSSYQADMYKYVIQSYKKYIPKAQQYGITIWGVTDNTSWLYKNGLEYPLLYNADYSKKPAYGGVLQGLQAQ